VRSAHCWLLQTQSSFQSRRTTSRPFSVVHFNFLPSSRSLSRASLLTLFADLGLFGFSGGKGGGVNTRVSACLTGRHPRSFLWFCFPRTFASDLDCSMCSILRMKSGFSDDKIGAIPRGASQLDSPVIELNQYFLFFLIFIPSSFASASLSKISQSYSFHSSPPKTAGTDQVVCSVLLLK